MSSKIHKLQPSPPTSSYLWCVMPHDYYLLNKMDPRKLTSYFAFGRERCHWDNRDYFKLHFKNKTVRDVLGLLFSWLTPGSIEERLQCWGRKQTGTSNKRIQLSSSLGYHGMNFCNFPLVRRVFSRIYSFLL